jgi:hypothetical protein
MATATENSSVNDMFYCLRDEYLTEFINDDRAPIYNFQADADLAWLEREIAYSQSMEYLDDNFDSDHFDEDDCADDTPAEIRKRQFE